eukprot:jgi/Ulvmu1/9763/UM056_0003.1
MSCVCEMELCCHVQQRFIQVVSNAHGETSGHLGIHLETIAHQLIKDCKLKKAASMIQQAETIFESPEVGSGDAQGRLIALAKAKILLAHLHQAQLQFHHAEHAVYHALRLCWEGLDGAHEVHEMPGITDWVTLIRKARTTHRPSISCRAFQKLTVSHDTAKLAHYRINSLFRVVRDALCTHSAILCQQGLQTDMALMCATSAAQLSRECDCSAAPGSLLSDCHVYLSMVQHILTKHISPFCVLAPWHCDRIAAEYFSEQCMFHTLIEANKPTQQSLRASWTHTVDDLERGCSRSHDAHEYFTIEGIESLEAMWPGFTKNSIFKSMEYLADTCLQAAAINGTWLHGLKLRLLLAMAYMSVSQDELSSANRQVTVALESFTSGVPEKCNMVIKVEALCLLGVILCKQSFHDKAQVALGQAVTSLQCSGTSTTLSKRVEAQWLSIIHLNMALLHDQTTRNLWKARESFECCIQALHTAAQEGCPTSVPRAQGYVMLCLGLSVQKHWTQLAHLKRASSKSPEDDGGSAGQIAGGTHVSNQLWTFTCPSSSQQEFESKPGESVSFLCRGVGFLQDCSAPPAVVCAAYTCIAAAYRRQASIHGTEPSEQHNLMSKACKAAQKACFVMGLTGIDHGVHDGSHTDQAAHPRTRSQSCIAEACLLNFEACLSALARFYSKDPCDSSLRIRRHARLKTTHQRQLRVAYSAALMICCDSHHMQASTRLYVEAFLLDKLTSLLTIVQHAPDEISEFIIKRTTLLRSRHIPSYHLDSDLEKSFESIMQTMNRHIG